MHLRERGVVQASQHGTTLEYPEPVSVCYLNPAERVLFNKDREINPFLHFFEPLWIIAGQEDVEFLSGIVSRFAQYSDNGETFYGAYGMRMRFPVDQIQTAVDRLRRNHDDRQVVLTIRVPKDITYRGKDQPCNLMIACKIRDGRLNIHVFNRSNDYIWGLTGANMPQFSTLQEYMAGLIGVGIGTYHQTTDSMHVYTVTPDTDEVNDQWLKLKDTPLVVNDPYALGLVEPYHMMQGSEDRFHSDLYGFFDAKQRGNWKSRYFKDVVDPMWLAFNLYKNKNLPAAIKAASEIGAEDWRAVTVAWLERRA